MNPRLLENNYVHIPGFISKEKAKVLANNFENFCKENNVEGDPQSPNSSSSYNYIDFLELLCNSTPEVGEFLGENVLPTYTYARVYRKSSELLIHTDRDACEISLTVHLDGDKDWPIFIKNPQGETISLNLKSGDAMIYLGCEAEHWREAYDGDRYVQVFLHYVKSRGENAYTYFDKIKDKEKNKIIEEKPKVQLQEKKPEEQSNKFAQSFKISSESKLINFIEIIENAVPDYLCDNIVKEYSNYKNLEFATIGSEGVQDTSIRNVLEVSISNPTVIQENFEFRQDLDTKVHECLYKVMQKYHEIHPFFDISCDSGYNFLKYNVGNFYTQHVDSFIKEQRSLSCSIALNDIDEYEGGEFAFFNNEIRYKIKKGSVIMFPSNFMYPHEILPVTKGTRYSIVTWFV